VTVHQLTWLAGSSVSVRFLLLGNAVLLLFGGIILPLPVFVFVLLILFLFLGG
jgi:hypothetical protein